MLHVKVWQEGHWVLQEALPDVGPLISKDQVAILDLAGVKSDQVKIRLESSLGCGESTLPPSTSQQTRRSA